MVFTLHRYLFKELFRVFSLAAVALTLILSLGSILRPVQEYGVGPGQVLHLIGYFLPITLTFVLPMSALFAGALVYGRFTSDNELDACRASGISILTMIYPGLILAIIVAVANLLLSFHVMPAFVHSAEKSFKNNAKQLLFRNIRRNKYYTLPTTSGTQYLIYADQTYEEHDALSGVIAVELKNGVLGKIITSDGAKVGIESRDRFNLVNISAFNAYQIDEQAEGGAKQLRLTKEFGALLGDDIKFKKIEEMKKIQTDLMNFNPIYQLACDTYAQLITELLARDIKTKTDGSNNYYYLLGEPNSVQFTAGKVNLGDEEEVELTENVVVIEQDTNSGQPLQTLSCVSASLHIEGEKLFPTLTMDIYKAKAEGLEGIKLRHTIRGLLLPEAVTNLANQFRTDKEPFLIPEKLISPLKGMDQSPELTKLRNQLDRKIKKTSVQIKAEKHSRLVFGIGCVPMILIGIGLGIIKKGGHLLSAFGASCVPAAVLIVCIMSGKQITENLSSQNFSGVSLMWGGLAALSLLAILIYGWLAKN
ncbi:MAG: LptF/LptG family permease [Sedimentisphaerales bacterium]|nr:LptF/LptG family permease [Sedimentisphaerales bacterium]